MGREYVVKTWVKHGDNDPNVIPSHLIDGSISYSGEQVGNRNAKSNGNTWSRVAPGWLPNGKADLSSAVDMTEESKGSPLLLVDSSYKTLLDYEHKVNALKNGLAAHRITKSEYERALLVLDAKLHNAEKRITKLIDSLPVEEIQEESPDVVLEEGELSLYFPKGAEKYKADYFYENSVVSVDNGNERPYDVSHREAITPINKRDKSLWQSLTSFFITMLPTMKE